MRGACKCDTFQSETHLTLWVNMLLIVTELSVYWEPHCEYTECRHIVYCLHKSVTCRKQNKRYGDKPSNTRSLLPSQLHAIYAYLNSIYSNSRGYRTG